MRQAAKRRAVARQSKSGAPFGRSEGAYEASRL